jgi:hypothetical protein
VRVASGPFEAPFVPPFEAQGKQSKQDELKALTSLKSRNFSRTVKPAEARTGHGIEALGLGWALESSRDPSTAGRKGGGPPVGMTGMEAKSEDGEVPFAAPFVPRGKQGKNSPLQDQEGPVPSFLRARERRLQRRGALSKALRKLIEKTWVRFIVKDKA